MKETKTRETRSYKASDITSMVQKTLAGTVTVAASKNYVMRNENAKIDSYAVVTNATKNLEIALVKMSKNDKKRIFRAANNLNNKFTLEKLNRLIKVLAQSQGMASEQAALFAYSVKEQTIKAKRKTFTDAVTAMLKAKAEYQEEKGSFYKNNLN